MTQNEALIILNALPGLGNRKIRQLLETVGSAQNVLKLSAKELAQIVPLSADTITQIDQFSKTQFLKDELARIHKANVKVVGCYDAEYPQLLKNIPDAPIVLYIRGNLPAEIICPIALVGSRSSSVYGTTMAHQFAGRLVEYGFTIISGLARGIDTAAHQGALQSFGKTIAVLGCGLDHMYPAENAKLAHKISETGAVISEFPMAMPPLPHNFPRRNRIISGMSLGVIVVEAALKSGALITADFALEQGREVYAIPGKIDYAGSQGTNRLIKQGAKLVMSVEDVVEDIKGDVVHFAESFIGAEKPKAKLFTLSEKEEKVFNFLSAVPKHFDEIVQVSQQNPAAVNATLSVLELKKAVVQLPGKYFKR